MSSTTWWILWPLFSSIYLKDQLYEAVGKSGLDMSQFQFDWVVTVPAIWDVRGKQMMREAAYKVRVVENAVKCVTKVRKQIVWKRKYGNGGTKQEKAAYRAY